MGYTFGFQDWEVLTPWRETSVMDERLRFVAPSTTATPSSPIAEGSASTTGLADQKLGLKEVDDGIWLVSFLRHNLGYRPRTEEIANNRQPVRHEVVTYVLGTICYLCARVGQNSSGAPTRTRTRDPLITNRRLSLGNCFILLRQ
jgi:hypothetical protein